MKKEEIKEQMVILNRTMGLVAALSVILYGEVARRDNLKVS